jgi:Family of unknown function (DUF6460)
MSNPPIERFLGGSPVRVIVRLLVISVVVGFILAAFDLDPITLVHRIVDGVRHLIEFVGNFGLSTVTTLAKYLLAGAVIVIPIWLLARLLSMRKGR